MPTPDFATLNPGYGLRSLQKQWTKLAGRWSTIVRWDRMQGLGRPRGQRAEHGAQALPRRPTPRLRLVAPERPPSPKIEI